MTYWLMSISGFLVALAIAHIVSARRWRARIEAARKRLAGTPPGAPVSEGELPAPVAEFARRAIAGVHVAPRAVTLTQRAEMRLSPAGRWFPVAASQTISIAEPGFLWLARARMLGVLPMEVIDAFVGGEGWLEVRLFGSLPIARAHGNDLDRGELMRYLAELVWAPHAMLHNAALGWKPLGGGWVQVAAPSRQGPAPVRLLFDEAGDISRIAADDRPRTAGRAVIPTPWRGRFSGYRDIGGLRVPAHGEVSWMLPEGEFTYWRGEITALKGEY